MTVHNEIVFTSRNFRIFGEIVDTYESRVRVQESSGANEYCCWIQCGNNPHLNVEQAKEIIQMLQNFIDWQPIRWPESVEVSE